MVLASATRIVVFPAVDAVRPAVPVSLLHPAVIAKSRIRMNKIALFIMDRTPLGAQIPPKIDHFDTPKLLYL